MKGLRSEMIAAAGCVCLLAALSLWLGARVSRQRQLLSMERMRGSALYADLYALVCIARQHDLDEVRVERDRVSFFSMQPAGCLGRFDLTVGGYRYLNDRQVLALSQVLAMDLPVLQSDWNYRLRRIRVTRPNGMQDDAYLYSARSPYKARLLAARRKQARTVE